jgi:hypothetical protein
VNTDVFMFLNIAEYVVFLINFIPSVFGIIFTDMQIIVQGFQLKFRHYLFICMLKYITLLHLFFNTSFVHKVPRVCKKTLFPE